MQRNLRTYLRRSRPSAGTSSLFGVAALALAGSAVLVNRRATQAERDYLPKGRFVTVDGVRLHYMEKGTGPVVFLHGNGAMVEDMLISGVPDHAASAYRAIVFDRPGYGHSERPQHRTWTAVAQASLFAKAFAQLGLGNPIVVGHSWGTLAALALALDHPQSVGGLVLASGYYFPTPRRDVALFSPPSMPIVGDVISYTVAPHHRRGHRRATDHQDVRAPAGLAEVQTRVSNGACPAALADQGFLAGYVSHDSCSAAVVTALWDDYLPHGHHGGRR